MNLPDVRREAAAWALATLLAYLVWRVVGTFAAPLIWASVLAIFFFPAHRRIQNEVQRPNVAALISTVIVTAALILPITWMIPRLISQASAAARDLPTQEIVSRLKRYSNIALERLPGNRSVEEFLNDATSGLEGRVARVSAQLIGNLAEFVIDLIVLLLALFFLFREGPRLVGWLRDISPFGGDVYDQMARQAIDMITVTISANFVVAIVQGGLGALSFLILSLPSPLFWGVMMALFSFIPFIGTWVVWGPAAAGLLLSDQVGRGIALLALGGLLVGTIDNFLRPALIAGRTQMNGLLTFISLLGGIAAFGLLGIVVGPLILATAIGLLAGYRDSVRRRAGIVETV